MRRGESEFSGKRRGQTEFRGIRRGETEFWHATYCLKPLINLCIIIVIIKTCLGGKGRH